MESLNQMERTSNIAVCTLDTFLNLNRCYENAWAELFNDDDDRDVHDDDHGDDPHDGRDDDGDHDAHDGHDDDGDRDVHDGRGGGHGDHDGHDDALPQ
ncbi:hypothetical protein TNCT_292741 [Trichonephila clavata]|uniref:Uncharacterized protein n=1 Tax=Trichonephila clavata TaxID=2740835 RepID=A0A8X6F4Q0_TRICU|nr:hypothetical protein TNCT_292741 [Trichonephila clavata]